MLHLQYLFPQFLISSHITWVMGVMSFSPPVVIPWNITFIPLTSSYTLLTHAYVISPLSLSLFSSDGREGKGRKGIIALVI